MVDVSISDVESQAGLLAVVGLLWVVYLLLMLLPWSKSVDDREIYALVHHRVLQDVGSKKLARLSANTMPAISRGVISMSRLTTTVSKKKPVAVPTADLASPSTVFSSSPTNSGGRGSLIDQGTLHPLSWWEWTRVAHVVFGLWRPRYQHIYPETAYAAELAASKKKGLLGSAAASSSHRQPMGDEQPDPRDARIMDADIAHGLRFRLRITMLFSEILVLLAISMAIYQIRLSSFSWTKNPSDLSNPNDAGRILGLASIDSLISLALWIPISTWMHKHLSDVSRTHVQAAAFVEELFLQRNELLKAPLPLLTREELIVVRERLDRLHKLLQAEVSSLKFSPDERAPAVRRQLRTYVLDPVRQKLKLTTTLLEEADRMWNESVTTKRDMTLREQDTCGDKWRWHLAFRRFVAPFSDAQFKLEGISCLTPEQLVLYMANHHVVTDLRQYAIAGLVQLLFYNIFIQDTTDFADTSPRRFVRKKVSVFLSLAFVLVGLTAFAAFTALQIGNDTEDLAVVLTGTFLALILDILFISPLTIWLWRVALPSCIGRCLAEHLAAAANFAVTQTSKAAERSCGTGTYYGVAAPMEGALPNTCTDYSLVCAALMATTRLPPEHIDAVAALPSTQRQVDPELYIPENVDMPPEGGPFDRFDRSYFHQRPMVEPLHHQYMKQLDVMGRVSSWCACFTILCGCCWRFMCGFFVVCGEGCGKICGGDAFRCQCCRDCASAPEQDAERGVQIGTRTVTASTLLDGNASDTEDESMDYRFGEKAQLDVLFHRGIVEAQLLDLDLRNNTTRARSPSYLTRSANGVVGSAVPPSRPINNQPYGGTSNSALLQPQASGRAPSVPRQASQPFANRRGTGASIPVGPARPAPTSTGPPRPPPPSGAKPAALPPPLPVSKQTPAASVTPALPAPRQPPVPPTTAAAVPAETHETQEEDDAGWDEEEDRFTTTAYDQHGAASTTSAGATSAMNAGPEEHVPVQAVPPIPPPANPPTPPPLPPGAATRNLSDSESEDPARGAPRETEYESYDDE